MKLATGEIHLLRLIRKDRDPEGWAKVSTVVMPLVKVLPSELCEIKEESDGGKIRLTTAGEAVVDWI